MSSGKEKFLLSFERQEWAGWSDNRQVTSDNNSSEHPNFTYAKLNMIAKVNAHVFHDDIFCLLIC